MQVRPAMVSIIGGKDMSEIIYKRVANLVRHELNDIISIFYQTTCENKKCSCLHLLSSFSSPFEHRKQQVWSYFAHTLLPDQSRVLDLAAGVGWSWLELDLFDLLFQLI
jgi:hypothetical protein